MVPVTAVLVKVAVLVAAVPPTVRVRAVPGFIVTFCPVSAAAENVARDEAGVALEILKVAAFPPTLKWIVSAAAGVPEKAPESAAAVPPGVSVTVLIVMDWVLRIGPAPVKAPAAVAGVALVWKTCDPLAVARVMESVASGYVDVAAPKLACACACVPPGVSVMVVPVLTVMVCPLLTGPAVKVPVEIAGVGLVFSVMTFAPLVTVIVSDVVGCPVKVPVSLAATAAPV